MRYDTMLKYLAFAQGAYGSGTSDSKAFNVGDYKAIAVGGFTPKPGSGINPTLYCNEKTGEYVIAYAGTVVKDANRN